MLTPIIIRLYLEYKTYINVDHNEGESEILVSRGQGTEGYTHYNY